MYKIGKTIPKTFLKEDSRAWMKFSINGNIPDDFYY